MDCLRFCLSLPTLHLFIVCVFSILEKIFGFYLQLINLLFCVSHLLFYSSVEWFLSKMKPLVCMIAGWCLLKELLVKVLLEHAVSIQFSSVPQSCPTLCDPMNYSMPGLPVHHQLLESTQTHVHRVGDAIQPTHPLLSPSPPALYLSQHQGLFKWVRSSHQVAEVLEFQLQHQSFQWTLRTDLL